MLKGTQGSGHSSHAKGVEGWHQAAWNLLAVRSNALPSSCLFLSLMAAPSGWKDMKGRHEW